MVHKTSHRGVHSGNTLRAFNSRYSRRYHNQACILSRVHPDLLKKLAGGKSAIGDKTVLDDKHKGAKNLDGNVNVAVGVALSLNKQSRWLLPSALIRQIESDDIAQELTVSLLERHKLKRPANCISFHSNKIEGTCHRGRYFGFNYPTADGKSRRALRRERRKALRQQNKSSVRKTMTVFTETGNVTGLGESEVRYEVFYPSPATSSISHNPKYIKQDASDAPGHDDHTQFGKPRKQHCGKQRKRMTLKDIDDCDLPAFHDFDAPQRLLTSSTANGCPEITLTATEENAAEDNEATDFLLSSLIEKAERLQNIVDGKKSSSRKKSGKNSNKTLYHHHQDDKSHIIYLPETPAEESSPQVAPVIHAAAPTECTRILLPTEDVTMATLKECFQQDYFEAACLPRKFVLDVTSNVRDLLKKCGVQSRVADNTPDALSYLIFIHDGFYNEEYDVYMILLNSKLHQGLIPVKITTDDGQEDLYRGTVLNIISNTMDFVKGFVTQLQEENYFPCYSCKINFKAPNRELKPHLGCAEFYTPSVQQVFSLGSAVTDVILPSMSDLLEEEPVFCDVCYDDISPLTQDSAAATSLLKCRHKVCDNCWTQHIQSRLTQGFVRVTCPSYDCQEEVKVGVLLSLATLDIVEKVLQRQEEVRVGASATEKWCPGQDCGRVIHVQAYSRTSQGHLQQDVMCVCGAHICFQCLCPAHWPATCTQAKNYRTNLATLVKSIQESTESRQQHEEDMANKMLMVVEGKFCPSCKSFVYKDGGGPEMSCRCGQSFCWHCARPGPAHHSRQGCVTESEEKKITTTVLVHHLENSKEAAADQQKQKSASRRQRVSLLEKAADHRRYRLSDSKHNKAVTNLAKVVSTAANKHDTLAQHIISICSPHCLPSSSQDSLMPVSSSSRVLDVVTSFLKRLATCKHDLYEVTEYTLVLLKDIPDSVLRRRALRISEDLNAFFTFVQSIFDTWGSSVSCCNQQEGIKALTRLVEIQGWIKSALASHVTTIRKLRSNAVFSSDKQ